MCAGGGNQQAEKINQSNILIKVPDMFGIVPDKRGYPDNYFLISAEKKPPKNNNNNKNKKTHVLVLIRSASLRVRSPVMA